MVEGMRIDLQGPLAGKHIIVDPDAITMGFFEDLQSDQLSTIMDAIASVISGGDLDRAGLRKLRPAEFKSLIESLQKVTVIDEKN